MSKDIKGLPDKTRQKLSKVAQLQKQIREREENNDPTSTLTAHKKELIDQIKAELIENDRQNETCRES